jgi:hypothetical protein
MRFAIRPLGGFCLFLSTELRLFLCMQAGAVLVLFLSRNDVLGAAPLLLFAGELGFCV